MSRKEISVLRISPISSVWFPTGMAQVEKFGPPPKRPISGVIRSLTTAWMTLPKAAPITTPTARSTTFPRTRNFLKPLSSLPTPWITFDAPAPSLSLGSADISQLLTDHSPDGTRLHSGIGLLRLGDTHRERKPAVRFRMPSASTTVPRWATGSRRWYLRSRWHPYGRFRIILS